MSTVAGISFGIIAFFVFLFFYFAFASLWGLATHFIGKSKGRKYCFWWGFGLGLIGLIVVLCLSDIPKNITPKQE